MWATAATSVVDPDTGERRLNYAAIDRALRLLERQAKLLGLDAPQTLTITTDMKDQITGLLDDIQAMLEREQAIEATAQ